MKSFIAKHKYLIILIGALILVTYALLWWPFWYSKKPLDILAHCPTAEDYKFGLGEQVFVLKDGNGRIGGYEITPGGEILDGGYTLTDAHGRVILETGGLRKGSDKDFQRIKDYEKLFPVRENPCI